MNYQDNQQTSGKLTRKWLCVTVAPPLGHSDQLMEAETRPQTAKSNVKVMMMCCRVIKRDTLYFKNCPLQREGSQSTWHLQEGSTVRKKY